MNKAGSKNLIRPCKNDRVFDGVNTLFLLLIFLIVAYPLYFIIIASFSDPHAVSGGQVALLPKGLTLSGYRRIWAFSQIWLGYRNSIFYTFSGTIIALILTVTMAYPLSRQDFKLRKPLLMMVTFTMFFGGGMIPTYLCINKMGMINTIWAVILPGAISASHVIIVRTFFQGIPSDLTEAAAIDGCTNFRAFIRIVLPLSKAVIAVIALYVASGLWNSYFGPMIYLTDRNLYPLQLFLRQILIQNDMSGADISAASVAEEQQIAQLIRYGIIIVSTVPMMIMYPFIQKYFVKGVMIGSIKG
ncbi:MAG: carbohydrate ABC transporter permease [Christensenellales bacterium]|jgi:putative aldouronate transport system permease protein